MDLLMFRYSLVPFPLSLRFKSLPLDGDMHLLTIGGERDYLSFVVSGISCSFQLFMIQIIFDIILTKFNILRLEMHNFLNYLHYTELGNNC